MQKTVFGNQRRKLRFGIVVNLRVEAANCLLVRPVNN